MSEARDKLEALMDLVDAYGAAMWDAGLNCIPELQDGIVTAARYELSVALRDLVDGARMIWTEPTYRLGTMDDGRRLVLIERELIEDELPEGAAGPAKATWAVFAGEPGFASAAEKAGCPKPAS